MTMMIVVVVIRAFWNRNKRNKKITVKSAADGFRLHTFSRNRDLLLTQLY